MKFFETLKRRREKKYQILYKRGPSTLALIFAGMALALWGMFAVLSSYPVGLYLYYTVLPKTTQLLSESLRQTSEEMVEQVQAAPPVIVEQPAASEITRDPSLPAGHYLSIPKVGIETTIWEGSSENYEAVLRKGVWRIPDFGDPESVGQTGEFRPMILAAHRFGYLEWSQDYRIKNSFYYLPKLKVDDEIEIVWDQHRYVYKVTQMEEGTEITDYSSDLILYTCKFLQSPIRIMVYAKLVQQ